MKKIVIIEDDMELQRSLRDSLSGDFSVFQSYDGESGLKAVFETKPDLIVLDLILPKKSGFETLKEIKEKAEFKEIPVVILSNLEGKKEIEKAMSSGAEIYLVKAYYTLDEITRVVKNILDKK